MFRRIAAIAAVLAAVMLLSPGQPVATARAEALPTPTAAQAAPDPGSTQDVEAFIDGFVAAQMRNSHIAGATVAVVKDGNVVLVKGYGYADVATFKPVDGQTTLFRPGSISKLFVWTAVMQLAEQGKIDLNADVNTYLKTFKIPDAFGKPVTMLNLMTHTAGFEETVRDLFVDKETRLQSLDGYLTGHMPDRVYPPGTISSYSNYGATLAAYIVQEVSGTPFDDYVEKNIFNPLGMTRSTFRQPLPDALKADMSRGYLVNGGQYTTGDFELVNAAPAGSLSSTAGDMAKFMIAHLADGELILKPETAKEMHAQAWTPSPEIEGMAHGFYSEEINGQRIIQHGGDTTLFHSELMLIPDQKAGLFVSYNTATGASAGSDLAVAFVDRYYPEKREAPKPPADFKSRLQSYVGSYGLARVSLSTPLKILGLFQIISVSPGPDDTLLVTSVRSPNTLDSWVEEKPGVLKMVGGSDRMVYLDEVNGQYQTAYIGSVPVIAALRSPWYATTEFGLGLLIVCVVLFLTGVLAAPVGLFGPRVKAPADEPRRGLRLAARWAGFAFCLLSIVYLVLFGAMFGSLTANPGGSFAPMDVYTWLARLGVLFALAMIPLAYFAWRGKYWSLAGRIHYTLLVVAAWAYIAFELYWRLV